MWFSFLSALFLSVAAPPASAQESEAPRDFSRDFNWAAGVSGAAVLPTSSAHGSLSKSLSLGVSLARGSGPRMAWHLAFDRSAHILENTGRAFRKGTETPLTHQATEGTARQIWSRFGLRWNPHLGGNQQTRVTGVLGWGIGAIHSRNTLDVPAPQGDTRIQTISVEPSFQTELGLQIILQEWIVVHIGSHAGLILGFDPSEIGGGGQVPIYGRITPTMELLARF
ncbi:MAG: hypothetical protein VX519_11885 [Myxococcota bacterium]|nr:hypothetical protein [Myxococcota bacterium]